MPVAAPDVLCKILMVINGCNAHSFICTSLSNNYRTNETDRRFNGYLLGKNRRNAKAYGIKSDLSVNNDVVHAVATNRKLFFAARRRKFILSIVSCAQTACAWRKPSSHGYGRLYSKVSPSYSYRMQSETQHKKIYISIYRKGFRKITF